MLRNIWGGVGWGVIALVHIFDATQHMGWGGVGSSFFISNVK